MPTFWHWDCHQILNMQYIVYLTIIIHIQGVSEKIVHSIFLIFCALAPVLLRSQKNVLCFYKLLFIEVILNIIDFPSSNYCLRYEYDFHTSRSNNISLALSQILLNTVSLIIKARSHIPFPFKAWDNLLYWKYGCRN